MRVAGPLLVVALSLISGCYYSSPGVVHTDAENPIVTVGAGRMGSGFLASYLVDRRAQVCWFYAEGDHSIAPLDCCALLRVAETRPYLTWLNEASCSAAPRQATGAQSKSL
jgi:hypothetical protein